MVPDFVRAVGAVEQERGAGVARLEHVRRSRNENWWQATKLALLTR